ncbi:MAG: 50S ribosomal protein L25 [Desulfobacca sp.]|nr:50S ribosomal protein L25 [Desulfobacca sp.]
MEQVNLEGFLRNDSGKGQARALRRAGNIPAIFYGPDSETTAISVARVPLEKILKKQTSENTLYQLTIKGKDQEMVKTVMLKDLQKRPLDREILHADFLEVSLTKKIDVTVSLRVVGKAPGVEKGGILQEVSRELEIRCLPTQIPNYLEVDVSTLLDIGDVIHVQDLTLPEGVQVLSDAHLTLITVVPPVEDKTAAPTAAAEPEVEVVAKKGKAKTEGEG